MTPMTSDAAFTSFEQFWPHYVREHAHPYNRACHFIGTTAAAACIAGAVLRRSLPLLVLAPIVGYGASWIGHFFVETNVPAAFKNPWWSLRGDLRMWRHIVTGTMQEQVDQALKMPS